MSSTNSNVIHKYNTAPRRYSDPFVSRDSDIHIVDTNPDPYCESNIKSRIEEFEQGNLEDERVTQLFQDIYDSNHIDDLDLDSDIYQMMCFMIDTGAVAIH